MHSTSGVVAVVVAAAVALALVEKWSSSGSNSSSSRSSSRRSSCRVLQVLELARVQTTHRKETTMRRSNNLPHVDTCFVAGKGKTFAETSPATTPETSLAQLRAAQQLEIQLSGLKSGALGFSGRSWAWRGCLQLQAQICSTLFPACSYTLIAEEFHAFRLSIIPSLFLKHDQQRLLEKTSTFTARSGPVVAACLVTGRANQSNPELFTDAAPAPQLVDQT